MRNPLHGLYGNLEILQECYKKFFYQRDELRSFFQNIPFVVLVTCICFVFAPYFSWVIFTFCESDDLF